MAAPSTPTTIQFIQAQSFTLAGSGGSVGDVTLTLQSFLGIDGTTILTADLGSFCYATIEPGSGSQEESIFFTGVTQNANGTATLTGVNSISFKQPYTVTTGLAKTHAGAVTLILSNEAAFYNNLVLYMNSIAGAGAANASTTVKGIVQTATTAQVNAGTPTGSTGAVLAVTPDVLAASTYALSPNTLAALTGTSGTPSTTNKFVTQASLKFGGTGSDGALAIASGTTTIDCANASIVIKNYTSVSITGTGKLAFINPHTNGTTVVIKSQGNVTLTSSTAPMIDMSSMGSVTGGANTAGVAANTLFGGKVAGGASTGSGGSSVLSLFATTPLVQYKPILIGCGSSGGGGATLGAGGVGGGGLVIECAGAWNFTVASGISVAGGAGAASSGGSTNSGGGGGGSCLVMYNTLTANTGTITVSGGNPGTGGGGAGGTGGATGYSLVTANNEFL